MFIDVSDAVEQILETLIPIGAIGICLLLLEVGWQSFQWLRDVVEDRRNDSYWDGYYEDENGQ